MYSSIDLVQRIQELVQSKNIIQKEMFKKIGLNENTLTNLRKGKRINSDSLAKIADYLDCSVDYLLGRIEQINYSSNSFTLNTNEQTMLNTFRHLSLLDQHAAIKHLQFLLSESSNKQSTPTNTTAMAARNSTLDIPPEINNNDLETTISQFSEQE